MTDSATPTEPVEGGNDQAGIGVAFLDLASLAHVGELSWQAK
ncbi:hypothetical protein [Halomonas sp. BC04]|nr:hypothetical protein [Halomonas sp. BC04]EWG97792.1 hypothetical protein Q427_34025 [Halomonas sp. BC04]